MNWRNIRAQFGFVASLAIAAVSLPFVPLSHAEGLPEPPLVLYGTIRNTAESNRRLTTGTLTWQFRKISTGRSVTLSVPLENVLLEKAEVIE